MMQTPQLLKQNGGWCWFQDPRAIIAADQLIFATIAGSRRAGADAGDVQVSSVDLTSGQQRTFTLHPRFQADDHNVPALLELTDGRILATYQAHGGGEGVANVNHMHARITRNPRDITDWHADRPTDTGMDISYSNLHALSEEKGRIYNFFRGAGNPYYLVSDDGGQTFRFGGRLLHWPRPSADDPRFTGIDGGRPYVRYASNGRDTIHLTTTEDHPRGYDNSIYHGFIKGGVLHQSDGTPLGPLSTDRTSPFSPQHLTCVYEGGADRVAWTSDITLDAAGHPVITFSVQHDGQATRGGGGGPELEHSYHHARWDGHAWQVTRIAHAGTRLYRGEDDYTGLVTLDPHRPGTLYISTNADPVTGKPLISNVDGRRHWEIFRGDRTDLGRIWQWTPLTANSAMDNIRPIVPQSPDGRSIVLWLRGTYTSYTDYDLDVVGLL